jgi:hypothetical protein
MVVAVVAMGMMQMAIDEVIDMIAMRHRLVAATGTVAVSLIMTAALMLGGAGIGVRGRHLERVLFHAAAGGMMQMAIVEVIGVAIVLDGRVAARRPMLMRVPLMSVRHFNRLLP